MQPHKTTSNIDDLANEIQFEIPEAVFDSIQLFVRRAIVRFCEESHFWREDIGPVRVTNQTNEYDLPTSRTVDVVEVEEIYVHMPDGTKRELDRSTDSSVRYRYWQPTPTTITVNPLDTL